jgi:hypothetical protein
MISLATSLQPVELTDSAMRLASALLQIASDPAGTTSRLAELAAATQTLRDAIALNEATAAKAADVEAQQAAVTAREQELASREDSLLRATTQLSVASHANSSRDDALNTREATLDRREADVATKEQALAARLEQYRAALA